jgi:hypothetical protein
MPPPLPPRTACTPYRLYRPRRYAAISKFLNDTEEYLHRLAQKVAMVRHPAVCLLSK